VWLPSQVSKLSDREGSFVQTYLQALSWRIYHDIELSPGLKEVVDPIWERLSLRPEAAEVDLPDRSTLNFFQFDEKWIARRVSTLGSVIQALETVLSREQPQRKTVSRRYTEGLSDVPRSSVVRLLAELRIYSEAVQEARSPVTAPDGLADLAGRDRPVDDRRDHAGLEELAQRLQILRRNPETRRLPIRGCFPRHAFTAVGGPVRLSFARS
jgi:hypothetical protein